MKTITTTIKWHNAAEELPERSCKVVVWVPSLGYCTTLSYSARHRLFNVHDFFTETDARRLSIRVQYWCYKEELMKALFPKKRKEKTVMTNEDAIEIYRKNTRQIPKKPFCIAKGTIYRYDDFMCPYCSRRIISNICGEWVAGKQQKYCDYCGQALDWSEIKE